MFTQGQSSSSVEDAEQVSRYDLVEKELRSACHQRAFYRFAGLFSKGYQALPSAITGLHFPQLPRLPGNFFVGQLGELSSTDGGGMDRILRQAMQVSASDSGGCGLSYFSVAHKPVLVVGNSEYAEQVLHYHQQDISKALVMKTFPAVFGEHNMFGMAETEEWRKQRTILQNRFFTRNALKALANPMHIIADEHVLGLSDREDGICLEQFATETAMDIMGRTQMGTGHLDSASVSAMSDVLGRAVRVLGDPMNLVADRLLRQWGVQTPTVKIKRELHDVFEREIATPHRESILDSNNLLKAIANRDNTDKSSLMLDSEDVRCEGSFLLLAGHETTARLLQFTLLLLADTQHDSVLQKLRQEITDSLRSLSEEQHWSQEHIGSLHYLQSVLQESLRLYPPVPVFAREVVTPFVLTNTKFTKDKEKYAQALQQRDAREDITVPKGCLILFSPWAIHKQQSVYGADADEFNPNRFEMMRNEDNPGFLPFARGARECIGRKFSMQEAGIIIAKLVMLYDLRLEGKSVHHPFPVIAQGTLKCAESIRLHCSERAHAPTPSNSMRGGK